MMLPVSGQDVSPWVRHPVWVRISHWIGAASVLVLAFTGVAILMVHPRLYWGETGNDLTPALLELKISRNYKHGGWTSPTPFANSAAPQVSASRTYDIFNQNGWARSLHFLAAWCMVVPGIVYLINGLASGHFRSHFVPRSSELARRHLYADLRNHLRRHFPPLVGRPQYGVLQKIAYSLVVFVATPLMVLTGITMAPAVTAAFPILLTIFGGFQSARTIHFFAFLALTLFTVGHIVMVARSGFRRQIRGMILGK